MRSFGSQPEACSSRACYSGLNLGVGYCCICSALLCSVLPSGKKEDEGDEGGRASFSLATYPAYTFISALQTARTVRRRNEDWGVGSVLVESQALENHA